MKRISLIGLAFFSMLIGVFGMIRQNDLPEVMRTRSWTESPLIIRKADGAVHPEYAAVKLSFGFPP